MRRFQLHHFAVLAWAASLLIFGPVLAAPQTKDPEVKGQRSEVGDRRSANRLARETSPYLLMHAHNPVDWYAWGPEAFAKAKQEGKLVFLSIGYSSCYWCHVMERESFENPEVAALLNQGFVSIKVDREERPDIDSIYMTALQALGQHGGWPLSMFLTADGKPIVGGTYWPTEDQERDGRKARGFKSVLKFMREWQASKPQEMSGQSDRLAELTAQALAGNVRGRALVDLDRGLVAAAVDSIRGEYDREYGGFGSPARSFRGTKFPLPPYLELVLYEAERVHSPELTAVATGTLDHMARGGIYDQLGGGFHRYSTERTWTVPHFEKMLYDNAQLLEVYARAWSQTGKPLYKRIADETMEFIRREMTSPQGGFYSALDAETGGEEGRFYVWTDEEIAETLPNKEDAIFVKAVYGIDAGANFETRYHIPLWPKTSAETAQALALTEEQVANRLAPLRRRLFDARASRPRPFLDTKILTAWNGQMIAGLAVAGHILNEPSATTAAERAADFVLGNLRGARGRLRRSFSARPGMHGEARLNAYLDDYAFLVRGLLCLHDATGNRKWLDEAKALNDIMVDLYEDKDRGGFFFTSSDHEKLFARAKDQFDNAQPSGNSIAAMNLVHLWTKTGDERYRALTEKTFKAFAGSLKTNPSSLVAMAHGLGLYLDAQEARGQLASARQEPRSGGGGAILSDSKVQVRATAERPDAGGNQVVTLSLRIEPGWHVYANPAPPDFPGIPTTVTVEGKNKPESVKVEYPKGKLVRDQVAGDHSIYEGTVVIKATVRRAKADASPLGVRIMLQACNENKCLQPATVKLTVP
jgi:uncharacterized protein